MRVKARFEELCDTRGAHVAGVLSGTSADGIDVALCRLQRAGAALEPPQLLRFETLDFPPELGRRVRAALDGEPCDLRAAALLGRDLGRAFGRAAREVADRARIELDLVGSHGQTVYHHDGNEPSGPASLQLGDGDHVAEEAGCAVVSDFRQRDLAAGGEGAPISALADDLIFARLERPLAILNLGGMGNLTVLRAEAPVLSFDTGPAGSLLDGLARRTLGRDYDPEGATAARGRVDAALLDRWLRHPFFERPPPRSTGRETFGEPWVGERLAEARANGLWREGEAPADLLATATELVARSVADSLARFGGGRPRELLLAGGGVHHRLLVRRLAELAACPVASAAERGIDPDAREGLVFALLAARCVLGIPSTQPSATGARPGRILGKISLASRPG